MFNNIFWRIGSEPMLYFEDEMPKKMDIIGKTCLRSQSIGSDNPCILLVTLYEGKDSYTMFEIRSETLISCEDVINSVNEYCRAHVPVLIRSEIYSIGYSAGMIEFDLYQRDTRRMNSPENC
jgi:hypothetical protein